MADSKWNGGTGDYLDPAQWTPAAVPLYDADTIATIDAGTVTLSNAEPNNITLVLGGPSVGSLRGPVLVLDNAALGPEMTLDLAFPYATLDVEGYDTNFGTIGPAAARSRSPRWRAEASASSTRTARSGSDTTQASTSPHATSRAARS